MNKKTRSSHDEDLDDFDIKDAKLLGYYVNSRVLNEYTVYINEPVTSPVYYTNVVNMLRLATEQDRVLYMVNSPGGHLDGLVSLLDGTTNTAAYTVAYLQGNTDSAASILALHCDEVVVGDYATMLCHNVTYGIGGKGADIVAHVQHMTKSAEKLIRETYTGFFDEADIVEILNGKQIYLDADEIKERLAKRNAYYEALEESQVLEQE